MQYRKRNIYKQSGFWALRNQNRKKNRDWYNENYIKFRKEVKKRDKHRCQMPGCGIKGSQKTQVHHILTWSDNPSLRYEPRNGILLCKDCHIAIKNKEEYYIELFSRIVEKNYQEYNKPKRYKKKRKKRRMSRKNVDGRKEFLQECNLTKGVKIL